MIKDESEAGKQQQVTVVNYEISKESHDEEPKCCECCCGCGYKGMTITLAVLFGIEMLDPRGFWCIWNCAFFIFYCVMACNEPTSGYAHTAANLNNVLALLSYVNAGIFYVFAIIAMFPATLSEIVMYQKVIWYVSFFVVPISAEIFVCNCIGIGVIWTLMGYFLFQYIADRFYEFGEYFRRKKDNAGLRRDL